MPDILISIDKTQIIQDENAIYCDISLILWSIFTKFKSLIHMYIDTISMNELDFTIFEHTMHCIKTPYKFPIKESYPRDTLFLFKGAKITQSEDHRPQDYGKLNNQTLVGAYKVPDIDEK
ncbi:hypothetical protein RF11_14102 [Thelohanellus kitauei]|uniref:Uncharacterized protein n=1 Tax=Thelohanellus kitauei TaxID=669202 RepID=A0A0C2MNR6_THEKT|nr:hypothetical protein RF11_14102 [Thelohanellus kitauei]